MRKVLDVIGACLKLAFWVAMLVGFIFLIKSGLEFLSEVYDLPLPWKTSSSVEVDYTLTDPNVTFEEIYKAYKSNELLADDLYKNNRYRITAKINGMETGGLLNMTGGATLTMEIRVGNTNVFFLAEFEEDQEESLKRISVGDVITYEGTCLGAGSWTDCIIVEEG